MPNDENKGINDGTDLSGMFGKASTDSKKDWGALRYYREPTTPKVIQWAMKFSGGLIKNEKQAQYALLGFVVVAIIATIFIMWSSGSSNSAQNEARLMVEKAIKNTNAPQ